MITFSIASNSNWLETFFHLSKINWWPATINDGSTFIEKTSANNTTPTRVLPALLQELLDLFNINNILEYLLWPLSSNFDRFFFALTVLKARTVCVHYVGLYVCIQFFKIDLMVIANFITGNMQYQIRCLISRDERPRRGWCGEKAPLLAPSAILTAVKWFVAFGPDATTSRPYKNMFLEF